jgi:hypothetical protein
MDAKQITEELIAARVTRINDLGFTLTTGERLMYEAAFNTGAVELMNILMKHGCIV